MRVFVADVFTTTMFGGNQAGVVLLDEGEGFPEEAFMRALAGELKHSETAYVRREGEKRLQIRYFTPVDEVDLCGHATIGAFSLMRKLDLLGDGEYALATAAGEQRVLVENGMVYLEVSPVRILRELTDGETEELLSAYGLGRDDRCPGLPAALVSAGLTDIQLPVRDHAALLSAVQDEQAVADLSRRYDAVGVHMFCPGEGDVSAWCSNFAPLWGIPEECATGTANAGLTHYLVSKGVFSPEAENRILQGEHMQRCCEIRTRAVGEHSVVVGGSAVMTMECLLRF